MIKKGLTTFLFIFFNILLSYSQAEYNKINEFEQLSLFADEFNNNTNRWKLSELYPLFSSIQNSRMSIRTEDFPNWVLKSIPLKSNKDFQIEFAFKQSSGDSSQPIFFVFGFQEEAGYGFGFSAAGRNAVICNFLKKLPKTVKSVFVENSYPDLFNKFTIRKVKNKCYFYINEQLVFTENEFKFQGNEAGFYLPANTGIAVDYLNIIYLKPIEEKKKTEKG